MQEVDLSLYKHSIDINVRFMDLDALKHVNNARYLNFLEESRLAYSQELLGVFNNIDELNVVVARIEIDFIKPILYKEKVKVYTRISKVGNKSFVFDSVLTAIGNKQEQIAARALQTLVCIDPTIGKTIIIPSELKDQIREIEPSINC